MKLPESKWPWIVCGVLLLATMLNYMDRQALAVVSTTLKSDFNIAEARFGMVEGCFGYAFAFGSIFFGLVADRYGPRYVYPIVLAGWSLSGIATAFAGQEWVTQMLEADGDPPGTGVYRWLLLCRTVLGVFEAGHWPCALLTIRAVLSSKDRTLGNSILQSGASLGAIIVPVYIAAANHAGQSWEFAFWSIGIAGLLWIPLWFILIGNHDLSIPKEDASLLDEPLKSEEKLSRLVLRFITLAIVITMLTISWQFLRAWQGLFLQDYHGFSENASKGLMSGFYIAADVGCILSGLLVSALVLRKWEVHSARKFGFFIFTFISASAICLPFAGSGILMIAIYYTAGAGILGLHPFYYSLAQEISYKRMGVLSGSLAALAWCVSSTFQIFIGSHIEATQSYSLGLFIVGFAPVVGLIALYTLWPAEETNVAEGNQQEA